MRSLNGLTGPEIAVLEVVPIPAGFDARRDAISRTYCYRVQAGAPPSPFERNRALWCPYPLDRAALEACAAALLGRHDFTAFTPAKTRHVHFHREILTARWTLEANSFPTAAVSTAAATARASTADTLSSAAAAPVPAGGSAILAFWIEADAFLRGMVRALVGTMLEVGRGKRSVDEFERLLTGLPRSESGDSAPAHGLYLARVRY
ncbi:MAG TPA: hypothetical protein VFD37_06955 [Solirubrobacterales bacterium]|nr:hypothetical protein [Solirubrobacterales bacterium]